jgi:organic hydroperoxide reductase OsmC/OhrA
MAHEYRVTIVWTRGGAAFLDNRYSRGHVSKFDGGIEVPASSAPSSVRLPYSVAEAVDPEEALVAAISSCHMLTFLFVAAKAGFVVNRYEDDAHGIMTKNERGKLFVSRVTLKPAIAFGGAKQPDPTELEALHHQAHEECYIANSVRTEIVVEPSTAGAT